MKKLFVLGSFTLLAAAIAHAQGTLPPAAAPPVLVPLAPLPAPEKRVTVIKLRNVLPSVLAYQLDPAHNPQPPNWEKIQLVRPPIPEAFKSPAPLSPTPSLDAFAGVGRRLELRARWVQIDADALPTALPAWNALDAGARIASPRELAQMALLRSLGSALVTGQTIYTANNQNASLSFSPVARIEAPTILNPEIFERGPIDDMVIPIPQTNPIFDAPPYIPNLAKPESRLPEMAPMPGAGDKNDPPFGRDLRTPNPDARPQMSRELADLMAYKFQIRPTLIGDKTFALELRSLNSANNVAAISTINAGETAVFALPNISEFLQNKDAATYKARRTFLLVTPSVAPAQTVPSRSPLKTPVLPTP